MLGVYKRKDFAEADKKRSGCSYDWYDIEEWEVE